MNNAWNTKADGTGDSFIFGDGGTAVTDDITLYAQWANQQHTVSYDVNEGEGTPEPPTQDVNHNDLIAAAPTGISRTDYTLHAVWNTKADGTGESFKFGNGGTPVTADINLYAQWIKLHTVSYNVNEGEGTPNPETETVNHGETIAAAPTGISRTGYTLNNAWNTKADGTGDSFIFGDGGTAVTDDITLYAQWANQQHTVSYQANEGDGTPDPATQKVNHNDIIASAPTVSRTGYARNAAWNTKADGTGNSFKFGDGGTPVTEDITLYAQWTKQYTVSYDINEGDSTAPAAETFEDGGTFTKPADPTRSGYVFTGWFDTATGGNEFNFGTAVTADITLYAQWTIMTYTVSYNFNRGDSTEPSTETVEHGGTATRPTTDPTWTGYTFNGWFDAATGGDAFEFGTVVTTNIDLYAQWTIKQYTVSYNVNQGTGTPNPETQTVNHGETIATPPTGISRTGHTLNTAWNTQADGTGESFLFGDEGTPVTADITLYAQWSNQQHTVSYHANGGDSTPVPATQEINHNDIIATAPTVSRTGYVLNAAWNTQANGQGTPFIFGTTQVISDMDIYAQWTIQYTVSYHANGGDDTPNPATQAVTAGETIATAPTVSRNGYTLNAQWNTQADGKGDSFSFGSGGTPVTANMDLHAQWTINTYTVSYNFNRGDSTEPSTETVEHGGTATRPTTDPTWTGYTFNGWFDAATGGNEFNFGSGGTPVTEDMELYAQWTIKQYTVSYNFNRGDSTEPSTETVEHGGTATRPTTDPTRTGYTFNGWFDAASGGSVYNFGTEVTANIELYAQWIKQYTVSYNVNGGDSPSPANETVNDAEFATEPTEPTRTGYTFAGWFDAQSDGNEFSFGSGGTAVTDDITLYAQWTINTYTVSYNFNRGDSTEPSTETVEHGGTATRPTTEPTRTGYTFNGWFDAATGGNEFNFGSGGTPVTEDMELYAQWTIKQYTVSYNFNRGDSTEPSTETVEHGGTATRPTTDPARNGYTFTGWFDAASGGSVYNFGTVVTANITLYAQWTINTYTVSYNFNRGDNTEPSTETVEHGGTATRPTTDPARNGYTFDGWYTADTGGDAFDFGTVVTANITLYAQWTINTYTVSYNFNRGDSTEPSTETVEHGGTATRPTTDPARNGYTFTGWFDAASGGSVYNFGTEVTAAIELYAQWTPTLTIRGLSPADGSATTDITPTFSWDTVPGAAGYELRIADSQPGLENATTVSVTGTSYTPSAALTIGQTHYWKVRAKDWAGQYGDWSAVHSLEVQLPSPDFVHVVGGTFQMGSTESEAGSDESPVHSVTVDSFYMAETELTFDQYDAYCTAAGISKLDDSGWGRGSRPVINVSWYDAVKYSNWLSEQEGLTPAYEINGTSVSWNQSANGYRLPTEAEWEYVARGGAQSNGYKYSGSNNLDEVGWYWDNSGYKTQPVKGKKANELGLYDMSGNVWEWCWDWYDSYYYSSSPGANPTGPSSGSYRVLRGGGLFDDSSILRVAFRSGSSPGSSDDIGFRLVRPTD